MLLDSFMHFSIMFMFWEEVAWLVVIITFQPNEVSDNIWVVFMKTIINISNKSVSMIDNNTYVRLIHRNNDLFPQ